MNLFLKTAPVVVAVRYMITTGMDMNPTVSVVAVVKAVMTGCAPTIVNVFVGFAIGPSIINGKTLSAQTVRQNRNAPAL